MNDFYLPKQSKTIFNNNQSKLKNLGLLLDKYPPKSAIGKSEGKTDWLKNLKLTDYIDTELVKHTYDRWSKMVTLLEATAFNASIDWRMVMGLGGETVLETDLMLHHVYGIPYIPGSALKGLTRAYVTGEKEEHRSSKIDKDDEVIKGIFGSQTNSGTVLFFDAMPKDGVTHFVLDSMNPHYPKYYGQGEAPTNDQNPKPVTFLTVHDTTFTFALAPRNPKDSKHIEDVKLVKQWLQEALEKYGIGGKTSAGYGYFKEITEQPQLPEGAYKIKEVIPQTEPYQRPNIPRYEEGRSLIGIVQDPKKDPETAKRLESGQASVCLKWKDRELSTKMLLLMVPDDYTEAKSWQPGQMKKIVFLREEAQGNCTVWICKPQ